MATRSKLAVILHADVVGSTSLVQRDERVAHRQHAAAQVGDTLDEGRRVRHGGDCLHLVIFGATQGDDVFSDKLLGICAV